MSSLVEIKGITKTYPVPRRSIASILCRHGGLGKPVRALHDVSLTIRSGEVLGLLGPNGAGKTTLCKIICGIVLPTEGCATIGGLDVIRDHHEVTKEVFAVFGGETEMWGLFSWRLTVVKNLNLIARLWDVPKSKRGERIERSLEATGLRDRSDEWYQKLSSGEKQKVWLAALLVVAPRVALLDEPTIKLDVSSRKFFYKVLVDWLVNEMGSSVLLTSHHLNEIETVCDRVAILKKGEVIAIGSVHDILSSVPRELVRVDVEVRKGAVDMLSWQRRGLRLSEKKTSASSLGTEGSLISAQCTDELLDDFIGSVIGGGGRIVSVRRAEPTLEDAFLYLMEEG